MTLYRMATENPDPWVDGSEKCIGGHHLYVPVEPCVHGNYARHSVIERHGEGEMSSVRYSMCVGGDSPYDKDGATVVFSTMPEVGEGDN